MKVPRASCTASRGNVRQVVASACSPRSRCTRQSRDSRSKKTQAPESTRSKMAAASSGRSGSTTNGSSPAASGDGLETPRRHGLLQRPVDGQRHGHIPVQRAADAGMTAAIVGVNAEGPDFPGVFAQVAVHQRVRYLLQNYYSRRAAALLSSNSDRYETPRGGRSSSMATVNLMYGRKHQRGVNWITAVAMTAFHVGAIAALFFVDYGAMAVAFVLYVIAGSLGHRHGVSPPADAPQLQDAQVDRVLPHDLRHARARRRADLLGRHAPHPSSALGPGRRSAHAARRHLLGAHGLDHPGEGLHHDASVLARYVPDLARDPVPRLAVEVALGDERRRRLRAAGLSVDGPTCCGASSSAPPGACTRRGSSTRPRTSGAAAGSRPATTRPTTGGWRSWRSARAGTTTTTPTRPAPVTAWPGTSST